MKREDLIEYKADENFGNGLVYSIIEVNQVLDEKDAEIATLKAENEQLKVKLGTVNELVKTARQNLEDAKATAYADSVDAGMRERRLRRALWTARAKRASEKQQLFLFSTDFEKLCIDGFFDPYHGRKELPPKQWVKVFNKVEIKCLKKAEEY